MKTFLQLVAAHALADYPLQGDFLAKAKNRTAPIPGVPWYQALGAHAIIQGAAVGLITRSAGLGIAEAAVHAITDDLKCRGKITFNQDQAIHVACKALWAVLAARAPRRAHRTGHYPCHPGDGEVSLYPDYRPSAIKPEWEHTSMERVGSGEVLRRHGINPLWGNPCEAVAWFDERAVLRVLVADYAQGSRVTLRKRNGGSSIEIVMPARLDTTHATGETAK